MKMVLLRVGIDSGAGGIQGPLFSDGSFEFIPIPDSSGRGARTYGNTVGINGRPLVAYFPDRKQQSMQTQSMHVDPEFESFTYGDPTKPKAGLRKLSKGDILVFYAGLSGCDHKCAPALYIVGYFVVEWAGLAPELSDDELHHRCGNNFHVAHSEIFQEQKSHLVLVQGGAGSRLLSRARLISAIGANKAGQPLKVLSQEAQEIFGDFGGKISIQRSPPRWVNKQNVAAAKTFLESLP